MGEGWIKLWRKLLDSNMYKNLNSVQRDVLIQCLLLANHRENEWEWGTHIFNCKPGQFITSLESLRVRCAKGTSIKKIRTALLKLEKWHFLANISAMTGRMITIENWGVYQNDKDTTGKDKGKDGAKTGQRRGKDGATNKNVKNEKNEKNKQQTPSVFFHEALKPIKKYADKCKIVEEDK